MKKSKLIILGGANGSGKTTLAREFAAVENFDYLGADDIACELNRNNPEAEAISAARVFSQRLDDYLEDQRSVLVESTLSGLSLRKHLLQSKREKLRHHNFVCLSGFAGIMYRTRCRTRC